VGINNKKPITNALKKALIFYHLYCIEGSMLQITTYQRGPFGGGTSKGIKPLMQMVEKPCSTLRTYWIIQCKTQKETE
jgi:hypothetical protein